MNALTSRLLYWSPRILGILYAGFITMFAADVFDERLGFWKTVVALLMHLIPTAIVLAAAGDRLVLGFGRSGGLYRIGTFVCD